MRSAFTLQSKSGVEAEQWEACFLSKPVCPGMLLQRDERSAAYLMAAWPDDRGAGTLCGGVCPHGIGEK